MDRERLLSLQRRAGNEAVTRLLSAAKSRAANPVGMAALVVQRAPCPVTGEFIECPEGAQEVARGMGSRMGFGFTVRARFQPSAAHTDDGQACDPRRGEYRQFVKGSFEANGKTIKHRLFQGQPMTIDAFREDGQGGRRFGHRDESAGYHGDFYDDAGMDERNTATGEYFQCTDSPMMPVSATGASRMRLEFLGRLIDTAGGVLQERQWSANALSFPSVGGVTVPESEPGEESLHSEKQ